MRIDVGNDGVMVPRMTDAEKAARRQKIKEERRRRGRRVRPLPPRKSGSDRRYRKRKIITFCDQTQAHRLVSGTRGDCEAAGWLMRRDAGGIHLDRADEEVGNVDGSRWLRKQIERQDLPLDAMGLDFDHLSTPPRRKGPEFPRQARVRASRQRNGARKDPCLPESRAISVGPYRVSVPHVRIGIPRGGTIGAPCGTPPRRPTYLDPCPSTATKWMSDCISLCSIPKSPRTPCVRFSFPATNRLPHVCNSLNAPIPEFLEKLALSLL
jgi:hypothetical protein